MLEDVRGRAARPVDRTNGRATDQRSRRRLGVEQLKVRVDRVTDPRLEMPVVPLIEFVPRSGLQEDPVRKSLRV